MKKSLILFEVQIILISKGLMIEILKFQVIQFLWIYLKYFTNFRHRKNEPEPPGNYKYFHFYWRLFIHSESNKNEITDEMFPSSSLNIQIFFYLKILQNFPCHRWDPYFMEFRILPNLSSYNSSRFQFRWILFWSKF